ncbi:Phosphopantothenoylcysteine decarboxylase [Labilithrix luteola]|uniref:Coenzyme A biosynthesis bifunctional protein CoaBC n=1 Tax=Labilithrix luteola TaxID=1391654 RepID=A0A0K1Q898_9BACT|nr:bifunctional phosphopantothenoylcysteine decarboxylase/phosphopantothenate--cysteine ligase CoaBC [Labilithrix luteola]AKV02036.1 Phosphopantothenoylcysteine decarboxylase [Labilithrix luteola]
MSAPTKSAPLAGRVVALAVTGSIAAYKSVEVARLLVKAGAKVLPLMTHSATRFVGPVTLAGICGEAVALDMWDPAFSGEMHVSIATRADVIVIVPATADLLARLAQGRADDLVTATVLCAKGPVLAAPAMHPRMWTHPATVENVDALARQGRVRLIGPVDGPVASGESGMGRMADPESIVAEIGKALTSPARDLEGVRLVVTAGPTHEPLDPVRYLGNRSSGKMGFSIASRAIARGARVELVAGPVSLPTPSGARRHDVETAEQMQRALDGILGADLSGADALVMAAAVADFRPADPKTAKIKKGDGDPSAITLTKNPDLIAVIGARRKGPRPVLVAFALETGDDAAVVTYAQAKRTSKKVDLVVANAAHESLGRVTNRIAIVGKDGAGPFEEADKDDVADRILDRLRDQLRA